MHTTEPLVPGPSSFEAELAIEKLKRYKLPGTDHIPAEMIQARCNILHSEIHKLSNSIWNKEEFLQQWNESIIVPIYKNSDKSQSSDHRGISLLPTTYKMLPNILISRSNPCVQKIIGDCQCELKHNRSINDQILYIHQMLD
jgi:hypothetical protein